jgi:2-keto-3-deoxy-6-phosphogluconate aldolase
MASILNGESVEKVLREAINEEMIKAAEPVLKKALAEIEVTMRERMAACIISYIEQSFIMERCGTDLRIVVKQIERKPQPTIEIPINDQSR